MRFVARSNWINPGKVFRLFDEDFQLCDSLSIQCQFWCEINSVLLVTQVRIVKVVPVELGEEKLGRSN